MNDIDVGKLSLNGVRLLKLHCEELIQSCRADLAEYELYIRCQTELVRRGSVKENLGVARAAQPAQLPFQS